jgi:hypothetical protein
MRGSLPLVWLLLSVSMSCAEKDDPRPPPIGDCEDCEPGGGGGYTPPQGSNNDAMAPSNMMPEEDSGASMLGTLTGDVTMLTGTDLKTDQAIESEVEISSLAASGGRTTARYDGDQDFSLMGVPINGNLWVGVRPVGNPTRALMSTLQAVNSTTSGAKHLKIVERASLEEIAGASALLTPVTLDPDKGHLVIYFVGANDAPLSGVEILDTTAINGALVAYDAGNVYSDSLEETDIGGSALLLNLETSSFPGEAKTVAFNFDGLDSSFVVDVARDTITLAVVAVN